MWKNRFSYIMGMIAALGGFIMLDNVWLFLVFVSLLVLAIVFYVGTAISARAVEISCEIAQSPVAAGGDCPAAVSVSCNKKFPWGQIRLQAQMENMLFGDRFTGVLCIPFAAGDAAAFQIPWDCTNCGTVKVRLSSGRCQDMLGLFSFPVSGVKKCEFDVYPAKIPEMTETRQTEEMQAGGDLTDPARKGTAATDVEGIREYAPGDMAGNIHWKVSEKMDRLMVREYPGQSQYQTVVLLDLVRGTGVERLSDEVCGRVISMGLSVSSQLGSHHTAHRLAAVSGGVKVEENIDGPEGDAGFIRKLFQMQLPEKGDTLQEFFAHPDARACGQIIYVTGRAAQVQIPDNVGEAQVMVLDASEQIQKAGEQ